MVRKTADNSPTFYSPKMLNISQFLAKRRKISQIPGVWVIFPKFNLNTRPYNFRDISFQTSRFLVYHAFQIIHTHILQRSTPCAKKKENNILSLNSLFTVQPITCMNSYTQHYTSFKCRPHITHLCYTFLVLFNFWRCVGGWVLEDYVMNRNIHYANTKIMLP
jgi:hypothetical protein